MRKSGLRELSARASGKLAPSLAIVIIFCNVFCVTGINLYKDALFSLTEPYVPSLVTKVILGTDLSQFLQYLFLPTRERDGGTIPDRVAGLRLRVPNFPPVV